MEKYINERLRPLVQGDGGEMTFLKREDDKITVVMQGECSKCGMLTKCMSWCEGQIQKDLGEKVTLIPVRKKPFFWDR